MHHRPLTDSVALPIIHPSFPPQQPISVVSEQKVLSPKVEAITSGLVLVPMEEAISPVLLLKSRMLHVALPIIHPSFPPQQPISVVSEQKVLSPKVEAITSGLVLVPMEEAISPVLLLKSRYHLVAVPQPHQVHHHTRSL
jgi:hypothetical protein